LRRKTPARHLLFKFLELPNHSINSELFLEHSINGPPDRLESSNELPSADTQSKTRPPSIAILNPLDQLGALERRQSLARPGVSAPDRFGESADRTIVLPLEPPKERKVPGIEIDSIRAINRLHLLKELLG
jgi:hypothetical protein